MEIKKGDLVTNNRDKTLLFQVGSRELEFQNKFEKDLHVFQVEDVSSGMEHGVPFRLIKLKHYQFWLQEWLFRHATVIEVARWKLKNQK